jgi:hypothetical protein
MNTTAEATKKCPFCSETILADAIKCKHCQTDLRTAPVGGSPAAKASGGEMIGVVMLVLPLASTFLIWFWVAQMNLLQGPGSSLALLGCGTILATAILAAVEGSRVGAGTPTDRDKKGRKRSGPVTWFVMLVFLWVLGFPMWLYQRSRYGLKNLVVGGVLVAIIFAGSWAMMGNAIQEKQTEISNSLQHLGQ